MSKRTIFLILLLISILGTGVLGYLLKHHYEQNTGFCDLNSIISCSTVNGSEYAEVYGIPVALGGLVWFFVIFSIALYSRKHRFPYLFFLVFNAFGIASVLYFIYAEFQLQAICLWCTAVHILVLLSFVFSIYLYKRKLLKE